MSELDNSPTPSRPRSIGRFEFLAYLSLVLLISMFAAVREPAHDPETPQWQAEAPAVLIYILGRIVLILAAARRQQNWARWVYAFLVVLNVAGVVIASLPPRDYVFAPSDIITPLFLLADLAAVYFAFSRESAAWFHLPPPKLQ